MAFFDTRHDRAALILALLGVGLAIALAPYVSGLIGAPVLYVIFAPLHRWLARRLKPSVAASLVVLLAVLLFVIPGASLIGLLVGQAQDMATLVLQSPLLGRLAELRVGRFEIGPEIVSLGKQIVTWLGGNALQLLGTATRLTLNLLFALFGLYYLLLNPDGAWASLQPYIPFSQENTNILRDRFRAVTTSTVIGTGLTALAQGAVVAFGFTLTGLSNPLFWGVVTVVFAILPVVGSGMIWVPGVAALVIDGRLGAAGFLAIWCLAATAIVDYVIRPVVFNKYAKIHPLITLVGAVAGVSYFGLLGLLLGPLALSYFFEILRMYRQEHLPSGSRSGFTQEPPAPAPVKPSAAELNKQ